MLSDILKLTDSAITSAVGQSTQKVSDFVIDLNTSHTEDSLKTSGLSELSNPNEPSTIDNSSVETEQSPVISKQRVVQTDSVKDLSLPQTKTMTYSSKPKSPVSKQLKSNLPQGQNIQNSTSTSDDNLFNSNDVIAERYKSGEKQRVFKEKLKPRQQQVRSNRRIIQPTFVNKNISRPMASKSQSHNCADVVVSAVAPFVKIQETLENQINSLVSTLQNAHIVEKELITRSGVQNQGKRDDELIGKLNHVYQEIKQIKETCHDEKGTAQDLDIKNQQKRVNAAVHPTSHARPNDKTRYRATYEHLSPPLTRPEPPIQQRKETRIHKHESSSITKRKGKIKQQGKEIKPQVALLQTPVPRRKPPKPLSSSTKHGKSSVSNHNTSPKLSNRGLSLLRDIMAEQATPTKKDESPEKPPYSKPRPIVRETFHTVSPQPQKKSPFVVGETRNLHTTDDTSTNDSPLPSTPIKTKHKISNDDDLATKPLLYDVSSSDDTATLKNVDNSKPHRSKKQVDVLDELNEFSLSEECPLDKYLNILNQNKKVKSLKEKPKAQDDAREHALRVLRETQEAKERLEKNMREITRQHEEINVFEFAEQAQNNNDGEAMRIRKAIGEHIQLIQKDIQASLKNPSPHITTGKTDDTLKKKTTLHLPMSQRYKNNVVKTTKPFEKPLNKVMKQTKLKLKKNKDVKENLQPPPESSTAYDDLIYQHIYGKPPHQPHRHTLRHANQQSLLCSPTKSKAHQNTNKPAVTTEIPQNPSHRPLQQNRYSTATGNPFHFHSYGHNYDPRVPLTGNLYPTAVQIAEPSQDPSGRLPLTINNASAFKEKPKKENTRANLSKGPNVAVINVKSKDCDEESVIKQKLRSKVRERLKKKMKLQHQPLPNVDIDTSDPPTSEISTDRSTVESNIPGVQRFDDFISVHETKKDQTVDDDTTNEPDENLDAFHEEPFAIDGCQRDQRMVEDHGPAFPPQHYLQQKNITQTNIDKKDTLEKAAQELLEQELLARIVAQLDNQTTDPTLKEVADNISLQDVRDEDEESQSSFAWLEHIIGLQGMQLFIDAGIPVNQELVRELIRSVILERLETMFGYPQPIRDPASLQSPVRAQTESDVAQPTLVATPCRTPDSSPASVRWTQEMKTPERTMSELTEQSVNETVELEPVAEQEESFPLVPTPQGSMTEQELSAESIPRENIATPPPSTKDSPLMLTPRDVYTPNETIIDRFSPNGELVTFVASESPTSADDTHITTADLEQTPIPPTPIPKPEIPSTPDTPSTEMSISTAVGTSTYDAMSAGEHLHPSQAMSGVGSEGEMGGGMMTLALFDGKSMEDIENQFIPYNGDTQGSQIKFMIRSLLETRNHPDGENLHSTLADLNNNDSRSEGEIVNLKSSKSAGEVISLPQNNGEVISLPQDNIRAQEEDEKVPNEDTLEEISIEDIISPAKPRPPPRGILTVKPANEASTKPGILTVKPVNELSAEPTLHHPQVINEQLPRQSQGGPQSEISDGEFILNIKDGVSPDQEASVSDSRDYLSVGQLATMASQHSINQLTQSIGSDKSRDDNNDSGQNTSPTNVPRLVIVKNKYDEELSMKSSEGELASLDLLRLSDSPALSGVGDSPALSLDDDNRQVQMVLKLPIASDEKEELSEEVLDLSQYDMSSYGEL